MEKEPVRVWFDPEGAILNVTKRPKKAKEVEVPIKASFSQQEIKDRKENKKQYSKHNNYRGKNCDYG